MSQTNDYYVPVGTNDPAYQLLARYRQDYREGMDIGDGVEARVDALGELAAIVSARYGLRPACGLAARDLAWKYVQYREALKKLRLIAKKQLDHPYLAMQAEQEIRYATAILATIGYYCYENLRLLGADLETEVFDAMVRAKIFIESPCEKYTGGARVRCVSTRAAILASGADRPDLIAYYLRRLGLDYTIPPRRARKPS